MMVPLVKGNKRAAVLLFQRAYNDRAESRGLPKIAEDSECGENTLRAAQRACRALGAMEATLATARATKTISVGMQRMVRWPEKRSQAQLQRARVRADAAARAAKAASSGPAAALAEAGRWIGINERANRPLIMSWIKGCIGVTVRVPWCGVYVWKCLKAAGVAATGRCASVNNTLHDALNGRNGFSSCVYRRSTGKGSLSNARPGDVAGFFGESTHMGMLYKRAPGGWITREGNTSSNNQNNGGSCEQKFRPNSAIVYVARPRY